jgi:hypothetical protein
MKMTAFQSVRAILACAALAVTVTGCKGDKGSTGIPGMNGTTGAAGPTGPAGPAGATGATGPSGTGSQGPAGMDGSLRIYGDGSAGSLTVATGFTDWFQDSTVAQATPTPTNLSFVNLTIPAGATITVPSGTVIRCTGTFTLNGNISVMNSVLSYSADFGGTPPVISFGASNIAGRFGDLGDNTVTRNGGIGGKGLREIQARAFLHPGLFGGGEGAHIGVASENIGGGSFTVLAQGAIVIGSTGSISVNAFSLSVADGAGGGAGGVLILASKTSVTNQGAIHADGLRGSQSNLDIGAGGGGGGGIVHLLAPTITAGTITVAAGGAGTPGAVGSVTANPRSGGGGGGACGGDGGVGGAVNTTGDPLAGTAGSAGRILLSHVDPTPLY